VPVVVTAAQTEFWGSVRSDAADVRFADCDGRRLPFELERFDHAGKSMAAWVRLPRSRTATANTFFLYYANPDAVLPPRADVWDSAYQLVLHMNPQVENARIGLLDSSSYGRKVALTDNATPVIDPVGVVAGALRLDGTRGIAVSGKGAWAFGREDWTIELWARLPARSAAKPDELFSLGRTNLFNLYRHSLGFLVIELANDRIVADVSFAQVRLPLEEWTYIAIIREKGSLILWIGARRFEVPLKVVDFLLPNSADPVLFGSGAYGFTSMDLDEARISTGVARSTQWVKASMSAAAGTMLAFGAPESRPFR